MKNIIPLQNLEVKFTSPIITQYTKIDPKICEDLLKQYLLYQNDLKTISINQVGKAIRNNTDILIQQVSSTINANNWQQIKQRLKWLQKFDKFSLVDIMVQAIQISSAKFNILRQLLMSLNEVDNALIIQSFPDFKIENEINQLFVENILKNSEILINLHNQTQLSTFNQQLIISIKQHIKESVLINDKHLILILSIIDLGPDVNQKFITKSVEQLFKNKSYLEIQIMIDQAKIIEQNQFISQIQNTITNLLKNEQIIYQLIINLVNNGNNQFIYQYVLPKIQTLPLYQKYLLQISISDWMNSQKIIQLTDYNESLQHLKFNNEFIIASNYYWNDGEVKLNIDLQNSIKQLKHPILTTIMQQFKQIKIEPHQQCQLFSIIYHLQYRDMILLVTPFEYEILIQFKSANKIQSTSQTNIERLIDLGVVQLNGKKELQIIEDKLGELQTYKYYSKPIPKVQIIEDDQYEQNRKLILEAWTAKFMKVEKQMEFNKLLIKLNLALKKQLKLITEIELQDVVKGLVQKQLILCENMNLFYNI